MNAFTNVNLSRELLAILGFSRNEALDLLAYTVYSELAFLPARIEA